jgi:hypothetical protein
MRALLVTLTGACSVAPRAPCSLPPAACASADGNPHPYDASELQRLLPGQWLRCPAAGAVVAGPAGNVGLEFNADATTWWFLDDGGNGRLVPHVGFDSGGTVDIVTEIFVPQSYQLNMLSTGLTYGFSPRFTDGPPRHMHNDGVDVPIQYLHVDGNCAAVVPPGYDGGAADGSFGGSCDPNRVLPDSCPSVGGVACSICAAQCVQPCTVAKGGCPGGQTCIPDPGENTRAGDCVGFDGYCR